MAGPSLPARRRLGRAGDELQPVLRARRGRDPLPVRRRGQRDAARGHRQPGPQLALLPARDRARAALRLPRARALRAQRGPPLQPQQAPHRSLRQGDRGGRGLVPRRQRLALRAARQPRGRRAGRPRDGRRGRLRRRPQVRRHRRRLRLGGGPPARDPVRRHDHLRDPRQGFHHDAPRRARGPTWDLRRPRLRAGAGLPQGAGDHRGGVAADPPHLRRVVSARARACATTGATARSATWRRTPSTPPPAGAASRCASSRAWSRRCTRPASR